ncbi:hypothetical protein CDD83_8908 [Cordyceps sp. RAO-2017]|nr:hypothetical protein CDD83_8908 [Cordyceps sp. RAO-2017]
MKPANGRASRSGGQGERGARSPCSAVHRTRVPADDGSAGTRSRRLLERARRGFKGGASEARAGKTARTREMVDQHRPSRAAGYPASADAEGVGALAAARRVQRRLHLKNNAARTRHTEHTHYMPRHPAL